MTAQADVDAAVTAVQGVTADLGNAVTNIKAEIAALQAAGVTVDTTALDAAIAPLEAAQAAVDALETSTPPAGG
jgi:predicted negative regulator of RcsB-dependent stress response